MRSRALTLLLFLAACDLENVDLGISEQKLDPTLPPPLADPTSWIFLTNPVDNPEATTAAYLPGSSAVTPTGAYTYAIPLEVPPGRAGMQPALSLVYSSAATNNGILGAGWNLGGLSTITRCNASPGVEGFVDGIDFTHDPSDAAADRFCIDGQKLVLIDGTYGAAGSEYRTELDTFAKVTVTAAGVLGPTTFEVRTKEGRIRTYQAHARNRVHADINALLADDGPVHGLWTLISEKDRAGNEITYAYSNRTVTQQGTTPLHQITLDEIRYTGHADLPAQRSVKFNYVDRTDTDEVAWNAGIKSALHLRLDSIVMSAPNPTVPQPVWTYRFAFDKSTSSGRHLLSSVQRCAMFGGNPAGCTWKKQIAWTQAAKKPAFNVVDNGAFPISFSGTGFRRFESQVLDANGDGSDDFMITERDPYTGVPGDEDGTLTSATLRLGGKTGALATSLDLFAAGSAFPATTRLAASRPLDMNSDGKIDLWTVYGSDINGPSYDQCAHKLLKFDTSLSRFVDGGVTGEEHLCGQSKEIFLDWNGDGRLDRATAKDTWEMVGIDGDQLVPGNWKIVLNTGSGFAGGVSSGVKSTCKARVTDVDGDGRGELVTARPLSGNVGCEVPTLLRSIDKTHALETSSIRPDEFLGTNYFIDPRSELGDFNGDGLEDALLVNNGAEPTTLRWNTGAGYAAAQPVYSLVIPGPQPSQPTGPYVKSDGRVQIADFNRDGRSDVLILNYDPDTSRANVNGYYGHGLRFSIAFSNGDGTFSVEDLSLPYATYTNDFNLVRLGDFNGDGYVDIGYVREVSDSDHRFVVALQTPAVVDRVKAIRDEQAGWDRETITYSTDLTSGQAEPVTPCAFPLSCAGRRGITVVRSVAMRDHLVDPTNPATGRTISYTYEDPVFDAGGGGFIGFREQRAYDPSVPSETITAFNPRAYVTSPLNPNGRRYPSAQRPVSITTVTPIIKANASLPFIGSVPARVTRTLHTNSVRFLEGGKTHTIETTQTKELTWEQNVSVDPLAIGDRFTGVVQPTIAPIEVITTTSYDDYGNPRWINRFTTGGVKVLRSFTYDLRVADWLVGLVKKSVETRQEADGMPQQVARTIDMTYDARGLVSSISHELASNNPDLTSTTTLERDTFGSIISATQTGSSKSKTVNVEYEPTFVGQPDERMFASQVWAPFEMAEHRPTMWMATHPAYGVQFATMDANGVTNRMMFDWLRRPVQIIREGQAIETVSYAGRVDAYGGGNVRNGIVTTSTVAGRSSQTTTDARGLQIRASSAGFGGGLVHVASTYDALGRRTSVSRPFASSPDAATTYLYDSLGRIVEETSPDGMLARYQHALFETRSWDANNYESVKHIDVDGRLVHTANIVAGNSIDTTFTYAPFDLIDTVTDDKGNVVAMQYDALGRLVRRSDPDQGVTTAAYTALGELREKRHLGTGKVTTYEYDGLGRNTAIVDADGERRFMFDTQPNGIGKLARAESPDGVISEIAYDAAGRAISRTDTIGGVPYTMSKAFDAVGRIEQIAYPQVGANALIVKPTYNASSDVTSVGFTTNGATTTLLTILARNLDQSLTLGTLGNGVQLRHTYEPLTGRVDRLLGTQASGLAVLDLDYGYQPNGLVSSRFDGVNQRTERFDYDAARRLTVWMATSPTANRTLEYQYDTIGNLTKVLSAGQVLEDQQYGNVDGSQPHTLEKRTVGTNVSTYAHDLEGRRVSGAGTTIAFRENDLPRSLTKNGRTWTFTYDAFGARATKSGPDGTTTYVGDLYERRVGVGGAVTHVYFVEGPDGRLAQLSRSGSEAPAIEYVLTDALGSTSSVLDAAGSIVDRAFFEPFGLRINADGTTFLAPTGSVRDGFTGHEHDTQYGLINMRGRLYDPTSKQFVSADPVVSVPSFGQSWNPYSYVGNSPLNLTDPSGYRWMGDWSCMNSPGGCLDGGASADGPPPPPDGPTETSEGSQAAMAGFMAGSEAAMDGADVSRSDGAASGGRPGGAHAEVTIGRFAGYTSDREPFEIEYLYNGKMRFILAPKHPTDAKDFLYRVWLVALHRYTTVEFEIPLTEVPNYELYGTDKKQVRLEAGEWKTSLEGRLVPANDEEPLSDPMSPAAAEAAMLQAREATLELLQPYMNLPGMEAAVFDFYLHLTPEGRVSGPSFSYMPPSRLIGIDPRDPMNRWQPPAPPMSSTGGILAGDGR